MARHKQFEDLPVWQTAIELAHGVFDLTNSGALSGRSELKKQLERAVISISNNIAEGWERGTHDELIAFLYYARGSAGEVRSMLQFLKRRTELNLDLGSLQPLSLSTSRQLGAWLESLKNSSDRGPRYRTEATRRAREGAERQATFDAYLEQVRAEALARSRPKPEPDPPPPDPS